MSDRPSSNFDGLNVDVVRQIDEVCLRFEAAWREGRRPHIDDYLVEMRYEGRSALRAQLSALECELRQPKQTMPPSEETTVDQVLAESALLDAATPVRVRYFGDYELIREIARGGMGVVFHARQVSLNRPVALKMILAGRLADEIEVKRFYVGAEAAANLDHPNIVPIFEVGQHEGQHYFSMGLVQGQSLAQLLAGGPLPPDQAAALLAEVARAIEYAHSRGVIHRDLKPSNILLGQDGRPRVTDFGLAKKLESNSELTGSGQVMGTPSYMSPEQARGNSSEVGTAADVYALGATLYALLTGRPPFQAATSMETLLQVVCKNPVPPRQLNAAISRDLETICMKCLEKALRRGSLLLPPQYLGLHLGAYLPGQYLGIHLGRPPDGT
jgi:eukaryotic-like serine/threonine-protein kinase